MIPIYNNRVTQLFRAIKNLSLDGLYITNSTNIRYLTGFTGSASTLLALNDSLYFFTDGRYIKQSQEQIKNAKITIIDASYFDSISQSKLLNTTNMNIGFESFQMSVSYYKALLKKFPMINWQAQDDIIADLAAIKDDYEIEALKRAIEITDNVFEKIIPEIKKGVTEQYIAARISYLFKTNGAEGDSYESIIAGGPRSALPHARPTDRPFEKGDFIVMDFGALYNGYHADMTRTVLIGPSTEKHHKIYDTVLRSQLNGINSAKEGVACCDVDMACRSIIENAGYGDLFTHSTGHGIGLEVHTLPRLHKNNTQLLEANHVVTIEPGIYIPDWGGVRIEDDCLITTNSCIPLNKSTKELIVI